jgi:hypothetical protein
MADETIDDGDSAAAQQVAADIKAYGTPRTLTDEECLLRQIENEEFLEQCRRHREQQRLASEQARAEADQRARHEAAIADAEYRRRASREAMERSQRSRESADLYSRLRRMEQRLATLLPNSTIKLCWTTYTAPSTRRLHRKRRSLSLNREKRLACAALSRSDGGRFDHAKIELSAPLTQLRASMRRTLCHRRVQLGRRSFAPGGGLFSSSKPSNPFIMELSVRDRSNGT